MIHRVIYSMNLEVIIHRVIYSMDSEGIIHRVLYSMDSMGTIHRVIHSINSEVIIQCVIYSVSSNLCNDVVNALIVIDHMILDLRRSVHYRFKYHQNLQIVFSSDTTKSTQSFEP